MVQQEPAYTTRLLTPATWSDFETLFRKYHGVQAGCWCMFYHRTGPNRAASETERQDQNRRDHRGLVARDQAHGVLVYLSDQPVGWCQYGRKPELPRIDAGRKYRTLKPAAAGPVDWRITCFFVDRPLRHRGVARVALHAALAAIREKGGGRVEAYPATHTEAVASWFGSVSMFRREGFRVVAPFGRSNVLMHRDLPRSPRSATPEGGAEVRSRGKTSSHVGSS
jgi:GNAT superfamily N-acetyltransferase